MSIRTWSSTLRYNWGLTKIYDVDKLDSKNSVFQITLGYKFDL